MLTNNIIFEPLYLAHHSNIQETSNVLDQPKNSQFNVRYMSANGQKNVVCIKFHNKAKLQLNTYFIYKIEQCS